MLQLFRFGPAWGLPCVSPYVTKVAYYLKMTGHDFVLVDQNLMTLREDAPNGKLPYIIDHDGTRVHDSTRIIKYLKRTYGDPLDADQSRQVAARALAWQRMCEEHMYWCGMVPARWRDDEGYRRYLPYIANMPDPPPPVVELVDAYRTLMLSQFEGQGMGRRSEKEVFEVFQDDIDALEIELGDNAFFFGDQPHAFDAGLCATLLHILWVPFPHRERDALAAKKSLVDYTQRMVERFGLDEMPHA